MDEEKQKLYDLMRGKPNPLFGPFMKQVCQRAGVNQVLLGDMAQAEYNRMMVDGLLEEGDSGMLQQSISLVFVGKRRITYTQMLIWMKVLERHYNYQHVKDYFVSKNLEMPVLTQEIKDMLWTLSGYQSPDAVREAEKFASAFDYVPKKNTPKILPKHIHAHRSMSDTGDDLQIVQPPAKPAEKHTDALDYRKVKELQE